MSQKSDLAVKRAGKHSWEQAENHSSRDSSVVVLRCRLLVQAGSSAELAHTVPVPDQRSRIYKEVMFVFDFVMIPRPIRH